VVKVDEFLPWQVFGPLKISRPTLEKAVLALGIEVTRTGGGHRRYTRAQVEQITAYIERRYARGA
jgi:hypothetical protein